MSIGVMLIGGVAFCFALWKVWGIIKGKSGCAGSCGGCTQECPSKKK